MQPGTILTHLEGVKYAIVTLIGGMALVAAILAMLYTTASDALVSPRLNFGDISPRHMQGRVKQAFGDVNALQQGCVTPIKDDPEYGATTVSQNIKIAVCKAVQSSSPNAKLSVPCDQIPSGLQELGNVSW